MASLGDLIALAENVHDLCERLRTRFRQHSENPQLAYLLRERIQSLCSTLTLLDAGCHAGQRRLSKSLLDVYRTRLREFETYLRDTRTKLEDLQGRLEQRSWRAREVRDVHEWLQEKLGEAGKVSDDLLRIAECFTREEGTAQIADAIRHSSNEQRTDVSERSKLEGDSFRPSFIVPENPPHVILKFGCGADGSEKTTSELPPEEQLRLSVLGLHGARSVGAVGARSATIFGMKGMGGIGKSCALRGLALHDDVRRRFCDGIYWFVLGQDVTERTVMEQLARVTRESGGETQAKEVREERSLDSAVSRVIEWFRGKTVLLLIDDVWAGVGSDAVTRLKEIADVSMGSRVAFTAREWGLVDGSVEVKFSLKEDDCSLEILLESAAIQRDDVEGFDVQVERILRFCQGLPLALSVAGRAIAMHREIAHELSLKDVFDEYLKDLQNSPLCLLNESVHGYVYKNLSSAFAASLSTMDRNKTGGDTYPMSYAKMYESLVVMRRQGWLPLPVLCILWGLSRENQAKRVLHRFVKASLLERTVRVLNGQKTSGAMLHDLQLDYVEQKCRTANSSTRRERKWHAKLVEGWRWKVKENFEEEPWVCGGTWKSTVANEEYFRNNLCRHLKGAQLTKELLGVLSDPRWAAKRLCRAEGMGLQDDFQCFEGLYKEQKNLGETKDTVLSLQKIAREAKLSAPFVLRSLREVWFQLYDGLLSCRNESELIQRYLSEIERVAEKPWLKPLTPRMNASNGVQDIMLCEGKVKGLSGCAMKNEVIVWGKNETHMFRRTFRNGVLKKTVLCELSKVRESFASSIWSQNGKYIAKMVMGRRVQVWDMHTAAKAERVGQELNLGEVRLSCWDVTGDGKRLAHGEENGKVVLWNVENGSKMKEVASALNDYIMVVSFSSDGKRMASIGARESNFVLSGETGEMISLFQDQTVSENFLQRVGGSRYFKDLCISWCKTGNRIGCGYRLGHLLMFNYETGETIGDEEVPPAEAEVYSLSWSEDGKRLVCGGDELSVWDGDTGRRMTKFGEGCGHFPKIAVSGDGRWIAAADYSSTVSVWDVDSKKKVWASAEQHSAEVRVVCWLEDGKRMLSADASGKVVIWGWENLERVRQEVDMDSDRVEAMAWSSNDMCVFGQDGNVFMYHVGIGKVMWKDVETHSSALLYLVWSGDNKHVFSVALNEKVAVWDSRTGKKLWEDRIERTEWNSVAEPCWSHDGTRVLAGMTLWNVKTAKKLWERPDQLMCIAWSGDDKKLACGDGSGKVVVRSSKTGEEVGDAIAGHTSPVELVKWSPNGRYIASSSGGSDRKLLIWNWETGAGMWTTEVAPLFQESSLEWCDDGQRIAYANGDRKLVVWDVVTGARLEGGGGSWRLDGIAWSKDGSRVATLGNDRTLRVSNVGSHGLEHVEQYEDVVCFGQNELRQLIDGTNHQISKNMERRLRIRGKGDGLFYKTGGKQTRLATVDGERWYWSTSCRHFAVKKDGRLHFYELVEDEDSGHPRQDLSGGWLVDADTAAFCSVAAVFIMLMVALFASQLYLSLII